MTLSNETITQIAATHEALPNANKKRTAILDAALRLLASKGFHGMSIKQVADNAGVATGTVYLYFADRDDLIEQVHTDILEKVAVQLFTAHDQSQPFFDQYRQFCMSLWRFFLLQPEAMLSKSQFDNLPLQALTARHQMAKTILHPLMQFLEQGRAAATLKNLPDDVLLALAFEAYFSLARQHSHGLIAIDDVMLDKIIEANWHAIAAAG